MLADGAPVLDSLGMGAGQRHGVLRCPLQAIAGPCHGPPPRAHIDIGEGGHLGEDIEKSGLGLLDLEPDAAARLVEGADSGQALGTASRSCCASAAGILEGQAASRQASGQGARRA